MTSADLWFVIGFFSGMIVMTSLFVVIVKAGRS